jgi:hypothetical protein
MTAEELYHKIIENYDERNYKAEKDGIKLLQLYADEQSREAFEQGMRHQECDENMNFDEWLKSKKGE